MRATTYAPNRQAWLGGWQVDYPSPADLVSPLLTCPSGAYNF